MPVNEEGAIVNGSPRSVDTEKVETEKLFIENVRQANYDKLRGHRVYGQFPKLTSWTKHPDNPLLSPTEPWEGVQAGEPTVVFVDGEFKMIYSGYTTGEGGAPGLGLATSPDGVNWTKYPNNPVLKTNSLGHGLICPNWAYYEGTYYLYAKDGTTNDVYLFTSTDAKNWTEYGVALAVADTGYDELDNVSPFRIGDKYYLVFEGKGGLTSNFSVGFAISSDGKNFNIWENNPVLSNALGNQYITCPAVYFQEGTFFMLFGSKDSADGLHKTSLAYSRDCINWEKYRNNPIISTGTSGSWDDEQVLDPNVLRIGDTFYCWYMGYDGNKYRTGLATNDMGV